MYKNTRLLSICLVFVPFGRK